MPLASLGLVVVAALIHAVWNLLAKRAAAAGPAFVFAYSLFACLTYAPWVAWLLWRGALEWSWAAAACILLSGAVHLAYSLCLQRGYQVADLSVVYPVARGTGPLFSSLGAVLLLGETLSGQGVLGLFAVVAGIGLISTHGRLDAFQRLGARRGIGWGLGTGGMIAGYSVVDAYGVKVLGLHPVVLDWFGNAVRMAFLVPVVLSDRAAALEAMKGRWRLAAAVGMLAPLGYILVLGALRAGAPLSAVAPAREMSMMAGALLGMLVLREPVTVGRLAGCVVLIAGVALLSA